MHKQVRQFIILLFVVLPLYGTSQETTPLKNELYIAIEENNLTEVKRIIESGYDINKVFMPGLDYNFHGYTPLLAACYARSEDIACYLIRNGADVNFKPGKVLKHKQLMDVYAIDWAINFNMQKTIELLLQNNADVNHYFPNGGEYQGITPLHLAVIREDYKLAEQLILAGANVTMKTEKESDYSESTALHLICWGTKCNQELASLLIKNGGDINAKEKHGNTALHIAVDWYAPVDYISFLLQNGANAKLKNKDKLSAYDIAVKYDKIEYIKLLK